ncbi:MAG: hypothetical protein J6W19_09530 [Prevotella sp.]|nr:hypothetical protein [Prevotella sp.]
MKKLFAVIYALTVAVGAFATGQDGDVIYIDGERWSLLIKPVEYDSILYFSLKAALPKERSWSTANWDGYTGYWSIRDERLCLDSITVEVYDQETKQRNEQRIAEADMQRLFKDYYTKDGIVASWLSKDIRAAKGKKIYYQHSGYERNHEYEQVLTVKNGKVTACQAYHNKVVAEGFSLSDLKGQEDIKARFPLHLEASPELKGVKRIIFSVKHISLDASGNLLDCEVTAKVKLQDDKEFRNIEGLAKEMKAMLKDIRPWKTLLINGEYVPEERHGFTIPYFLTPNS